MNELTRELCELAAHIEAATYRLLLVIRELDELGGWDDPSMPSLAHWLGWRIGLNLNAAREKVRAWRNLDGVHEREHADYQRRKRYLKMYTDEDGMVVLKGRLTPGRLRQGFSEPRRSYRFESPQA